MRLAAILFGSALVLAGAGTGFAEVNCKRIDKMLEMGRSVDDIVTTSAGTISEEDVEACKAKKAEGGSDAAAGQDEKKGATE